MLVRSFKCTDMGPLLDLSVNHRTFIEPELLHNAIHRSWKQHPCTTERAYELYPNCVRCNFVIDGRLFSVLDTNI